MELYEEENFAKAVMKIHESQHKGVVAITGGGTGAIDELLKRGGGSATLLKAVVPYSFESWQEFLGKVPEKTVSIEAARQLAVTAFHSARKLDTKSEMHFGLGSTGALAKASNERIGRKHFLHIAFQSEKLCAAISVEFLAGNRIEQEAIASKAIVLFLSHCLSPIDENILNHSDLTVIHLQKTNTHENISKLLKTNDGDRFFPLESENDDVQNHGRLIFSGSFNPLHEGHLEVASIAESMTGLEVTYEIAVTNADKPPLDFIEIEKRVAEFSKRELKNIVLTNRPFFYDKVTLFTNSTFIVGIDTWKRIIDTKYGMNLESLFDIFSNANCKFLVFGRLTGDKFETLKDVVLPSPLGSHPFVLSNLIEIPESRFRKDISSSEIRKTLSK